MGFDDDDDDNDDRKAIIEALVSLSSAWFVHVDREMLSGNCKKAFVISTLR